MPWCEYLIKCYAYRRMQIDKWRHTRFIAFNARIGSHLDAKDSKQVPRSLETFLPLDEERPSRVTNEMRESFLNQYKEYLRIKNSKK